MGVFNVGSGSGLVDRRSECEVLDRLLTDVRAHQSRVLVLRGEAGIGKTALMDYLATNSSGCHVVRTAGVESEMELAFAGRPPVVRIDAGPRGRTCRVRNATRSARRSVSSPGRPPIGSWSAWRC